MQYACRCKCCSYTHAPVVPKDPQSLWLTSRYFSSSFFSNFLFWGPWNYNPKKWPYKCVTEITTPTYRAYNPMYTWEKIWIILSLHLSQEWSKVMTSPWFWAMIESHPATVGAAATRHTSAVDGRFSTYCRGVVMGCQILSWYVYKWVWYKKSSRRQPSKMRNPSWKAETECNFQTSTISALPTGFQWHKDKSSQLTQLEVSS